MSYKPSKNPKVEELTKSFTERIYPVSNLPYIVGEDGSKRCIWCGDPLKTKHPNTRYCKDATCSDSAYAWAHPQGDSGRRLLIQRQNFKCNICLFDWAPFLPNWNYGKIPSERAPEVDHVIPVFKGGQTLGLENHQAICYTCHKVKTKADVTGVPRKPKVPQIKCGVEKCRKHAHWRIIKDGRVFCRDHYNAFTRPLWDRNPKLTNAEWQGLRCEEIKKAT